MISAALPGSVYELSGSEVCFSTGDLVKVTGLTLISFNCEDTISGQISELPLNSKGIGRDNKVYNILPLLF